MRCTAEGCQREAARSLRFCWKHDYLNRYWTDPSYREKRKATKRMYGRKRLQLKRDMIAEALGGWRCVTCGNTDRDLLTFDHVNGGGEAERKKMGGQFPAINYYYMHLDEARRKLQVLCANCNWRRSTHDSHNVSRSRSAIDFRTTRNGLVRILGGPRCVGCGESDERVLTIDHIRGGGTADRNSRGGYWSMIRHYSTHQAEASLMLQVLCRNCNWKRHRMQAGTKYLRAN